METNLQVYSQRKNMIADKLRAAAEKIEDSKDLPAYYEGLQDIFEAEHETIMLGAEFSNALRKAA